MIKRILTIVLGFVILAMEAGAAPTCLTSEGAAVDWWVALKVPGKINRTGFGYYDSTMSTGKVKIYANPVDQQFTALWRTLTQINNQGLQVLAWNDENPNGTTSSSDAHSKTVIGVSSTDKMGFAIIHSIPKYPAFIGNDVNATIGSNELVYGQHALCVSVSSTTLQQMASRWMIIRPNIYHATISSWSPTLYNLSLKKFGNSTNSFQNYLFSINTVTTVRSIYKNNNINCSIFEDGLNNYLKSKLYAETWGRPLETSWCSTTYPVMNVRNVTLGTTNYTWTEADDHSKWVVADAYACFGDMNRMTSQWKRGGAFFCLNSPTLTAAMKAIIKNSDVCQTKWKFQLRIPMMLQG